MSYTKQDTVSRKCKVRDLIDVENLIIVDVNESKNNVVIYEVKNFIVKRRKEKLIKKYTNIQVECSTVIVEYESKLEKEQDMKYAKKRMLENNIVKNILFTFSGFLELFYSLLTIKIENSKRKYYKGFLDGKWHWK